MAIFIVKTTLLERKYIKIPFRPMVSVLSVIWTKFTKDINDDCVEFVVTHRNLINEVGNKNGSRVGKAVV